MSSLSVYFVCYVCVCMCLCACLCVCVHSWGAGGAHYTGEFLEGRYHGMGTFTWPDRSRYHGEWRGGVKCGGGQYYNSQGILEVCLRVLLGGWGVGGVKRGE